MIGDRRLERFYAFLSTPLIFPARFLLAFCVLLPLFSFAHPLWRIRVEAPQYEQGLSLTVYAHRFEAGHEGADLRDLNVLHHYIGMRPLDRADLAELDWFPFAIGFLVILTLRCAAIGDVRSLVDLVVTAGYAGVFSVARFVYRLHGYGHDLSPDAPMRVPPFSPTLFGRQQVGTFATTSQPGLGALLIVVFAISITTILVWHLVVGRRSALRARTARAATPEAP